MKRSTKMILNWFRLQTAHSVEFGQYRYFDVNIDLNNEDWEIWSFSDANFSDSIQHSLGPKMTQAFSIFMKPFVEGLKGVTEEFNKLSNDIEISYVYGKNESLCLTVEVEA